MWIPAIWGKNVSHWQYKSPMYNLGYILKIKLHLNNRNTTATFGVKIGLLFSHLLLGSDRNLHSDRGRDADGESGRKRSRSRSRSRDRDEETNHKRRRKRASRWSDRPPSPGRENDDSSNQEDRWRDRPLHQPQQDEPVVGDIYNGKISSIMQFGCFVQLEGLRLVN